MGARQNIQYYLRRRDVLLRVRLVGSPLIAGLSASQHLSAQRTLTALSGVIVDGSSGLPISCLSSATNVDSERWPVDSNGIDPPSRT